MEARKILENFFKKLLFLKNVKDLKNIFSKFTQENSYETIRESKRFNKSNEVLTNKNIILIKNYNFTSKECFLSSLYFRKEMCKELGIFYEEVFDFENSEDNTEKEEINYFDTFSSEMESEDDIDEDKRRTGIKGIKETFKNIFKKNKK
ncbi:hypothetical protein H312_01303 [Anncaliia algerae PRA339]|uniref:Uncharacterized protein n=1 Tax=Anncaliia algerae PRA339 TaxID=1288291 RepID=A0A059F2G9_9MICR|nr:hypothetical protein H312_01303 [Anncaliia algerae PRA339]